MRKNFVASEHHSCTTSTCLFTFSVVVVDLPDRLHLKFPFSRRNWRSRSSPFSVNRRRRRELRRSYCSKLHSHLFMPITLDIEKFLSIEKRTYTLHGLINRNNIFISKWMGLYPRGLKPGVGLKRGILRYRNTWNPKLTSFPGPLIPVISLARKREKMILGTRLPSSVTRTKNIWDE